MSERLQISLQAGIVGLVLVASLYGIVSTATTAPPALSNDLGALPTPTPTSTPTPLPTRRPTPTPSPTPTPPPSPRLAVSYPYQWGGRTYTVAVIPAGSTVLAPFDGATVELHRYQLLGGQIRENTAVEGVPVYPYVILNGGDGSRITYRPGALGKDTQLVAAEGPIKKGEPLFKVTGEGYSSWRDFYDGDLAFGLVVSRVNAAGADLDAAPAILIR